MFEFVIEKYKIKNKQVLQVIYEGLLGEIDKKTKRLLCELVDSKDMFLEQKKDEQINSLNSQIEVFRNEDKECKAKINTLKSEMKEILAKIETLCSNAKLYTNKIAELTTQKLSVEAFMNKKLEEEANHMNRQQKEILQRRNDKNSSYFKDYCESRTQLNDQQNNNSSSDSNED